jgi:hypothetical protein
VTWKTREKMAERGFQTELWTDPFIQDLSPEAKLLFIYLWTNKHCNQAGLYEITLRTIAFDTGLSVESLPEIMKQIEPKVAWYPEQNLVWVKNFLKRQCKSNSFLIAAAKSLKPVRNNGLVAEFINYNQGFNLISLLEGDGGSTVLPQPPHSGNTVYTPLPSPGPNADTVPDKESGVVKGDSEATSASESENGESLSPGDRKVIAVWRSAKGFKMSSSAAAELVTKLRTKFPDVDILAESEKWAARKISEPLTKKSRPAGQIWNFMEHRHKWNEEKRGEYEQREARGRPDAHRKDPLQSFRDAGGTVILSGEEAEAGNEDGGV